MKTPAIQKAFVLLSCTFLGLICGTLYLYSSYSPQFAEQLNYSVTDASSIALLGTVGVAVAGPIAGIVVDRKGYTASLLIGGTSIVCGYLSLKYQYDNVYSNKFLSMMLIFLIGCGSTFINSACMKCCAVCFPSIRGVATSLPLALYGLSAMFYSVIASIFYPGDTSRFLGLLGYSAIGILAICSPSVILCDREHKVRRAVVTELKVESKEAKSISLPSSTTYKPLSVNYAGHLSDVNISGLELVYSPKFWLLFLSTGFLAAIGQMYIYSVGYMVKALLTNHLMKSEVSLEKLEDLIQRDQQMQVSLLSIANCIGRILAGISGDIVVQSFHKSRKVLLFVPGIGFLVAQIVLLQLSDYTKLSLVSLLMGFVYGFTFCIMPIIVGDVFGMEHYSYNWGIVALAPILPSFYLTSLFGKIYDSNSSMDPSSNLVVCTLGRYCYSSIFKFTFGISIFILILITLLNFKSKYFTKQVITKE